MPGSLSPDRRWLVATVVVVALLAAGVGTYLANSAWTEAEACWQGDSGRHFYEGQRIGLALRNLEVGLALQLLEARDLWPPLQVAVYGAIVAIFGPDYRGAVLSSVLGWILGAAFVAGVAFNLWRASRRRLSDTVRDRTVGTATGILAAAWFASTPLMLDSAFLTMQEAVATMLLALALLFWIDLTRFRELGDSPGETRAAWRVATVTTALALWRYAMWMEWLIAWLIVEMVSVSRQQWSGFFGEIRHRLRWRPTDGGPSFWHQPLLVFATALFLIWFVNIAFHPFGESVVIRGRTISIRTGGNLLHAALLVGIAGTAGLWLRHRGWFRDASSSLPVVWRALLGAHVIPMTVWFVLPHRLRLFVNTFFFRPEGHKNVYDPLALIKDDLFAIPWLAAVLAVLAVVAVGLWRQTTVTGHRYLLLCLLVTLPVLTVPYEPRYALPALIPVVPLVVVTLARLLAEMVPSLLAPSGSARAGLKRWGSFAAIAVSTVLAAAILVSVGDVIVDGLPRPRSRRPEIVTARAAIVEAAEGQTESLLVVTDLDGLNPWQIVAEFNEHDERAHTGIVAEIRLSGREPKVALDETIREHRPERIIAYRGGPQHTDIDPVGVAVLAVLAQRTDYELLKTTPGGNDGDVIEVRVRSEDRADVR